MKTFDAIIIGAGQAGAPLAARFAAEGQTVALIERHLVGGTCVNTGCTPTKTMVASARAAHVARRAADFGVDIAGAITVDMKRVQARTADVAGASRKGLEGWLEGLDKVSLLRGHARFEGPDRIALGDEILTAGKIFINVGGRPTVPDIEGLADIAYLTNSDMVGLDRLPEHLLVLGGSYIGLEFAQMLARFGAKVTVVERGERLIGREDPEVSDAVRGFLEDEGVTVMTGAECIRLSRDGGQITMHADCGGDTRTATGSDLLVALGRRPNTDNLGLEKAGVTVDKRGYITVGSGLETSVPGIFALGDCNGRGAFTHTAYNDYEIVAANLFDGESRSVDDRIAGYALYTDPPLGRAGMSEAQAVKAGHRVLVSSRPMSNVARAKEKGETAGLMKLVADADTGKLLGGAILGPGGDEAIHAVLNLINMGATAKDLQWAVPIHPTVSELLPTLAGGLSPAG
ncbi:FAD-containing oxidoreductase [Martelella endophytica]|uniref:Mercuric reductase n=1 Tax=Martelella endophytica TaxID=1486262 RepID=A0A0D5LLA7_MAREN|nr:FAD-containing oxidoreductase [Martelella endophytica]AJY44552.1 mercuric reductase [Martelella endophytica]